MALSELIKKVFHGKLHKKDAISVHPYIKVSISYCPYIGGWSIHQSSNVWLPRYALMGTDVGVYKLPLFTYFFIFKEWGLFINNAIESFSKSQIQCLDPKEQLQIKLKIIFCYYVSKLHGTNFIVSYVNV